MIWNDSNIRWMDLKLSKGIDERTQNGTTGFEISSTSLKSLAAESSDPKTVLYFNCSIFLCKTRELGIRIPNEGLNLYVFVWILPNGAVCYCCLLVHMSFLN